MILREDNIDPNNKTITVSIIMSYSEFEEGKMNYIEIGNKAKEYLDQSIKDIEELMGKPAGIWTEVVGESK